MEKYSVSRETISKLKLYEASLNEWQNKFNLVSNSSLADAWNRHFVDSAQLFRFIPNEAKIVVDFGSGAGFPAMVLAIMAAEKRPDMIFYLVESITKKTLYLNSVQQMVGANVNILNERIENITNIKADVITSRAMCNLSDLLKYSKLFIRKNTICIFPKGKSYQTEIDNARKLWNFDCQVFDSETSNEGKILIIKNLSPRKGVN